MQGVVARIDTKGQFGYIRGADGREFLFHQSELLNTRFDALSPGSRVDFGVNDRTSESGTRVSGIHLAADEVSLTPALKGLEITRDQVIPEGIEGDAVLEASWESFPASDSPSWHGRRD